MDDFIFNKKFYLCVKNGEEYIRFLGNGIVQLLHTIEKKGSINLACKELELSYSKAMRIIQNCEKILKKPILIHKKGGFERSGSVLTEEGRRVIELWDNFVADCDLLLKDRVEKLKKDIE